MEKFLLIPLVGAIIGWSTNWIAVKMLFRPYEPITIPLINYKIQGVIPKRQDEIAKVVGQVVEEELLSIDDIIEHLHQSDLTDKLKKSVGEAVKNRLQKKIPAFLPSALKGIVSEIINDTIKKEIPSMIDEMIENMVVNFKEDIKPSRIVEDNIKAFNLLKLENVVLSIAEKELRHIEILGGVLGFVIGLVQLLLLNLLA